jgi:hypothetical protein
MVGNVVARRDAKDNIYPRKESRRQEDRRRGGHHHGARARDRASRQHAASGGSRRMSRLFYDAIQLVGLGLVVVGVAQWSGAAACVVAGVGLVAGSYLDARRG